MFFNGRAGMKNFHFQLEHRNYVSSFGYERYMFLNCIGYWKDRWTLSVFKQIISKWNGFALKFV